MVLSRHGKPRGRRRGDRIHRSGVDGKRHGRQHSQGRIRSDRARPAQGGSRAAHRERRRMGRNACRTRLLQRSRVDVIAQARRRRGRDGGAERPHRGLSEGSRVARPVDQCGRRRPAHPRQAQRAQRCLSRRARQRRTVGSGERQACDLGRRRHGGVQQVQARPGGHGRPRAPRRRHRRGDDREARPQHHGHDNEPRCCRDDDCRRQSRDGTARSLRGDPVGGDGTDAVVRQRPPPLARGQSRSAYASSFSSCTRTSRSASSWRAR